MEDQDNQIGQTKKRTMDPRYVHGPLYMCSSDYSNLILVSASLTGENYLSWNLSMIIALRAKDKLRFINGKCEMLGVGTLQFKKWQRVDSMMVSWILNAISKEIAETFLYTTSAKDLWEELEQCFGETNGPLPF